MSEVQKKEKLAVEFAPNAERNLEQIEDYITDNAEATTAEAVVDQIINRCNDLGEMPRSGKARDDIQPGVRSVTSGKYVIYYRIHKEKVEILRVWHGSRDQSALKGEL